MASLLKSNYNPTKIAAIIPCFNEAENLIPLYNAIKEELKCYQYEIVFVNDGSTDRTLDILKSIHATDDNVSYIDLSRNFGHQNALKAGLDNTFADCLITIDGDFQHPPNVISKLIEKWNEGFHVVNTQRIDTNHISVFKRITSVFFYRIINFISKDKLIRNGADFRLLDKKVVDIVRKMNENEPFLRGMISWAGFSQTCISFEADKRLYGKSKYSLRKMVSLSLKGITSSTINPLRLSSGIGFLFSIMSFIYGFYAIYLHFFTNQTILGWTSIIVSFLFITGLQFIMIGIIGEYVGKSFMQTKGRPGYIISESRFKIQETLTIGNTIQI
ncbi:glycosyltransferase family 2 protein [Pedobacter frigoris]|uniref:Glycosyltransferase family 2 protein n=1 Tax=Pedobacter frigoris TaxID=2571272 RepID=A0A4U1CJJ7_9SPHI|nr:glycosyltransferase family 2 protein [Pedobacter frigoris]TKC07180.1 glycosyltransferase family 2 protein [Pedobacter frigoris]